MTRQNVVERGGGMRIDRSPSSSIYIVIYIQR